MVESKYNFKELMKDRHSSRRFQSKEIPEEVLKDIISISILSPSWCNSQAWNIYVVSGNTLEEIRKEWISKNNQKIKGYADMPPGHRTDFYERSQKTMAEFFKGFEDPKFKKAANINEVQWDLFKAPTLIYLTLPKEGSKYSILDLGGLELAILLASKDHGVDSIPAYETIKYPDVIRKHVKIPENEDIIIGIALGYEDKNIINEYRSKKLKLEDCCHFCK